MAGGQENGQISARVLIVDDAATRTLLRDYLTATGFFDVVVAGTVASARKMLAEGGYDFVVAEAGIPDGGGLELLRQLRGDGIDTWLILLATDGSVEEAVEAMKLGAYDYLLKPIPPADLARHLQRAMEDWAYVRDHDYREQTHGLHGLSEALASPNLDPTCQLAVIAETVRENFRADGVSVLLKDDANAQGYLQLAAAGTAFEISDMEALMVRLQDGGGLLAHGSEVEQWLRWDHANAVPSIQSMMSIPLVVRGIHFGVLNVTATGPAQRFTEGHRKGLLVFGDRVASVVDSEQMRQQLQDTFTQTIEGFARALEAKDAYTHGHSDRVAMYARLIGEAMGLAPVVVDRLHHGGLMHDIGKIGIRGYELNKPQKLTSAEYEMFQDHPVKGRHIVEPIEFLTHVVPCVYYHHEAWDGTGYPHGLDGEAIPAEARVLAVADAYDAMTSDRPYRKALPHYVAVAEIKRGAGRQFDPAVATAFLSVIGDFRTAQQQAGRPIPD